MNKMRSRVVALLRGMWRRKWYLVATGVVAFIVVAIRWPGDLMDTTYEGKSLWDWLDLLIIPAVLAVAAYWINRRENTIEREIARERRHEDILQNYLDKMTDLMRDEDWLVKEMKGVTSEEGEDVQPSLSPRADRLFDIARVRTVSALRALEGDAKRQASVIHFLREAELYNGKKHPALLARAIMTRLDINGINLVLANLHAADLWGANLYRASLSAINLERSNLSSSDLSKTNLSGAMLRKAHLFDVKLRGARLWGTDLQEAVLRNADLQGASLSNPNLSEPYTKHANLHGADLKGANLLEAVLSDASFDEETIMPDGTRWSEDVILKKFTDAAHPEFWEPAWVKEERMAT